MRDRVQEATDAVLEILLENDAFREEYNRHLLIQRNLLLDGLIYRAQGYGKNLRAKGKFLQHHRHFEEWHAATGTMPQKVCNYRKRSVEWYGTQVWASGYYPNWVRNEGYRVARHWDIRPDALYVRGANPDNGTSVFGKDDGIRGTTKTLSHKTNPWKPKGELFISSGKKLQTHVKDKDTVERVKRIEFPEA